MIRKIARYSLFTILLLLVLLLGGSFFLLGTDSGFRFTADKARQYLPALTIAPTSGNLQSGFETAELTWQQQGLAIQAAQLEAKWTGACLLRYQYCLDKLAVGSLRIESRGGGSAQNKGSSPIELPEISLPLSIEATEVVIEELVLDLAEDSPPLVIRDIRLKASMNGSTLEVDWLLAEYENYLARLQAKVELRDDYAIDGRLDLTARGLIDEQDLELTMTIGQSLRDLQLDAVVSGALDLQAAARVQPLAANLPLQFDAQWQSLGWPLDAPETIESTDGHLSLRGDLDDYKLQLSSAIRGAQIPPSEIDLSGMVNTSRILLPTISVLSLDGYAAGSAAADWQDSITWTADLLAREINPGVKWPAMHGKLQALLRADGVVRDGQWTLNLPTMEVTGELRNFPLSLNSEVYKTADELWRVETLEVENGPNTLSLQGSYGEELAFDTRVDFPAIHYLTPALAGNLRADGKITGSPQAPTLALEASSSVLKSGSILLRDLQLSSTVAEAGQQASRLALSIDNINANGQYFQNLAVELTGNREAHTLTAFSDGPSQSSARFRIEGSLAESLDWQGMLRSSSFEVPANRFELAAATALSWDQQQARLSVDAHCWNMLEARLCLQEKLSAGAEGQARVALRDYPLQYLNPFLPATAQLSGRLSAGTEFSWGQDQEQSFSAQLESVIDDGTVVVTDDNLRQHIFRYHKLTLNTHADPFSVNSLLNIESEAMGDGEVSFTLNPRNEQQSIAGEVSLQGFDIGFLQAFMPEFDEVGGNLSVEGEIVGTLTEPVFNGSVALADPVLRSPTLPLSVDGGRLGTDISERQAVFDGKLLSGEGSIEIGGNASWHNNVPIVFVSLQGDALSVVQSPVVESSVSPDLSIRYSASGLVLGGKIEVPSAAIDIKDLPEGTTSLSSDVVIIEEEALAEQAPAASTLPLRVELDIVLGDDVRLSGYGMEARLQGDFTLAKLNEDPPQLNGEVRVSEGFYKSYGQDLSITDGQILFVGPIDSTTLNIDAVREIEAEDRVAGLHLEGPIADPTVTLFTTPADKSQESILSYIVLGRDLGSGSTASESSMLASAALALTLKQSKGITTGFAESLGISDFAMEADGSGDETQVVVSGRLSSRLLLRYGRSVFSNEETLYLRYDISRKLYLEAAQGLERAVDVFYSFSF